MVTPQEVRMTSSICTLPKLMHFHDIQELLVTGKITVLVFPLLLRLPPRLSRSTTRARAFPLLSL